MILILDDNVFRRKELKEKLTKKGYLVSCSPMSEYKCKVYPYLTIIVNPKRGVAQKLMYSLKTKYIVAKDNFDERLNLLATVPHSYNLADNLLLELEKLGLNEKGKMYRLGMACYRDDQFSIGGKSLDLHPMEKRLFKFFLLNPNKTFLDVDLCDYFPFRTDFELNLKNAIWKLNTKCNKLGRPRLIANREFSYYLNPDIYKYEETFVKYLLPHTVYKNEKS